MVDQDDVRAYLDRVAESGLLGRSTRRPALLEYLLRTEADGNGEKIKAYSIGLDVFDKPKDFDPTTDSSVRVEVGRLRTAIALFEASEWADTTIKVDVPLGTYRPVITQRSQITAQTDPPLKDDKDTMSAQPTAKRSKSQIVLASLVLFAALLFSGWQLVLWNTPTDTSGPPIFLTVEDFDGGDLGKELPILVRNSFLNNSIVELIDAAPMTDDDRYFVVDGLVSNVDDFVRVSVELRNVATKRVIWNRVLLLDRAGDLQQELDQKLNGELETRLIGAAKLGLEQRDINDLTPQQLFILGTWVSGPAVSSLDWETERVTLMKLALEKDPDFGPAHSVLADKYGFLANVHPDWDTPENLALSRFHAERATSLAPLDSNVMFNVAQSYWHAGRHLDSQRIFHRVTELDSGNGLARFFANVVPYWCDAVPDETMAWALRFDSDLSRDDPIRWIVLTWIATMHSNRQEYDLALTAATDASEIFQVGYTYMAHAMLTNKAGRPNAAQAILRRQYSNWPGITATHYATSTVPRLCAENPEPAQFILNYQELAAALE